MNFAAFLVEVSEHLVDVIQLSPLHQQKLNHSISLFWISQSFAMLQLGHEGCGSTLQNSIHLPTSGFKALVCFRLNHGKREYWKFTLIEIDSISICAKCYKKMFRKNGYIFSYIPRKSSQMKSFCIHKVCFYDIVFQCELHLLQSVVSWTCNSYSAQIVARVIASLSTMLCRNEGKCTHFKMPVSVLLMQFYA